MIAFRHPSRFCVSFGSSWCCFRSLRTRFIQLSQGLSRDLFPPTVIVVTCFATFVSSLLITWPYHERRFWATYVVIGLTIASLLNFSFLIRSFLVLPWIHLSIFISVVCIRCCSALCSAQHSLPSIIKSKKSTWLWVVPSCRRAVVPSCRSRLWYFLSPLDGASVRAG